MHAEPQMKQQAFFFLNSAREGIQAAIQAAAWVEVCIVYKAAISVTQP